MWSVLKFSDISRESWPELQPYVDTCLLPLTGLTGMESPWEATETLEKLRDVIDRVEIPFRGRIVTYPAVQYGREEGLEAVDRLCCSLREGGLSLCHRRFRGTAAGWIIPLRSVHRTGSGGRASGCGYDPRTHSRALDELICPLAGSWNTQSMHNLNPIRGNHLSGNDCKLDGQVSRE